MTTTATSTTNDSTIAAGPVLEGRGLRKAYRSAVALDGADLSVEPGESVAIMGPSGSGKSTLLHVLAGIILPDAGVVRLRGREVHRLSADQRSALRRTEYGFVFQSGQLLPELTAAENVALPLMLAGVPRRKAVTGAGRWFGPLGLSGRQEQRPGTMSGGQQQRVAIARAMVAAPGVVFADEPTGALDQATGADVMGLLSSTCRERRAALVLVTHDPQVASWCDRVVQVRDGHLSAGAR